MKTIIVILALTVSAIIMKAGELDDKFAQYGLVDITSIDSSIVVDLKYATTDNFMGVNMYGDLNKAYLRPEIANMVVKAQQSLKEINPEYTLVIYDAARPLSVQKRMFDTVQGTEFSQYVADPYSGGGFHNFGCAVDVTILYHGKPLEMGTPFDSFSPLSHIDNEQANLNNGSLSADAYNNRQLLRSVMTHAGFNTEPCEWWHFDFYTKDFARSNLRLLDF